VSFRNTEVAGNPRAQIYDCWQATMRRELRPGHHVVLFPSHAAFVAGSSSRLPAGAAGFTFLAAISATVLALAFGLGVIGGLQNGDAVMGLAGMVMLAGSVAIAAWTLSSARDTGRHRREGVLISGNVTDVKHYRVGIPYPGVGVTDELRISYRFLTPAGAQRTGQIQCGWQANRPAPAPGDQIAIVYTKGIQERVL